MRREKTATGICSPEFSGSEQLDLREHRRWSSCGWVGSRAGVLTEPWVGWREFHQPWRGSSRPRGTEKGVTEETGVMGEINWPTRSRMGRVEGAQ